jgi:RNA polymerase sigma-19 factor, ECF subfamily
MNDVGHKKFIERFNKGDQQAFQIIFNRLFAQLLYFGQSLINDREAAEEMVNDCFEKLYARSSHFDSFPNLRAYLYISVRNSAFNYLQKKRRDEDRSESYVYIEKQNSFLSSQSKGENEAAQVEGEVLKAIHEKIEMLPEGCKTIIKMIYFEGLKIPEVAERLNLSKQTVKNQKARAIRILKDRLKDHELALFIILYLTILAQENSSLSLSGTL